MIVDTQDCSGIPANANTAVQVSELIEVIEQVIRNDSTAVIPQLDEPDTSWVSADKVWAASAIDENSDRVNEGIMQMNDQIEKHIVEEIKKNII